MTRVLIVDDSKVIRNAARKMLGGEFDVVTAEDGDDGWAQIQQDTSIQVVFTDLVMPGINGFELLRDIRTSADTRIRALPVIVVTGIEDDEVARVRALELGATDFVTKPFTSIDLLARARAHASHQREATQLRAQTTLDALTGLTNKVGFLERLQQDMAYARRHQQPLALVCIELPDFRAIFLKLGKDVGERLLSHLAKMLRATIRKEDTAGRVGLGAFALSLPAGDPQGVARMVERLRAELAEQWPQLVGAEVPMKLNSAVCKPEVDTGLSASEAIEQCQARLASAPALAPANTPAPPPARATTPASAPARAMPPPLQIDPLLAQLDRGNPQPAVAGMPLILRRLLPLLRLMTPTQRDGLIRFLQQRN